MIGILDEYLDISLLQLQSQNANLFCRKEVENFVAKLLYRSPSQDKIQKLIEATTSCSSIMALDGLARIYFEADLIDLVIIEKSYVWKLINHFKSIKRAEKNICKLMANLM